MKDFNLSEKGKLHHEGDFEERQIYCYHEDDVKEFIERLKKHNQDNNWLHEIINQLAGDKLI